MKKILIISETSKSIDEIKSQIDFTKGIFTLFHPFVHSEFEVRENSHYYKLHHYDGEYNYDFGLKNEPEIRNIDEYEECSEELRDFDENIYDILMQKYPDVSDIGNICIEIYTYNYHP